MEADFQRDYGINLREEAERMSWRRFLVLLHNLSPYGAVAMRTKELQKQARDEDPETERRAAGDFFKAMGS